MHEKTAGNPFFAIQFLTALAEEGLLTFDRGAARWTWDLRRIRAKGYTDNVVDLMLGKLRPPARRDTRGPEAAGLSRRISARTATLAVVQGRSEDALHAAFSPAMRARLLFRQEGTYQVSPRPRAGGRLCTDPGRRAGGGAPRHRSAARRAHPAERGRGGRFRDRRPTQPRGRTSSARARSASGSPS